jgi:hypothetical protein
MYYRGVGIQYLTHLRTPFSEFQFYCLLCCHISPSLSPHTRSTYTVLFYHISFIALLSIYIYLFIYTQNNILTAPFFCLFTLHTYPENMNRTSKMSLFFCHKYRHIIFIYLILFASTNSFFTPLIFIVEG